MSSSSHPDLMILDSFKDRSPVLFDGANRIPAVEDVRNILIYVCFATLFLAFLIIFPGIRKERVSTFICVSVSLFLGAVILSTNFGTNWHVAQASISSPYRAFSKEKIFAKVVVRVGLQSVNISLQAHARHLHAEEINFNERFYWIDPLEMKSEHKKALAKGLPFPILTIAEYLSQDEEGFCWGRRYRLSGYFASICLWAAFSSWLLMNVFFCAVPRYGVYCMQVTGVLLLLTDAIYCLLLPRKPLVIPFQNQVLTFTYGWCFWLVLVAGGLAVVVGAVVLIFDILFPNKFSTILEIDYDTPYRYFVGNDAHVFGHTGCPHEAASPMSSSATDSTCCPASHNSRRATRNLRKMKSDASTSTTMSIPIKRNNDLSDQNVSSTTGSRAMATTGMQTTKAEDKFLSPDHQMRTAFSNPAFEAGEDVPPSSQTPSSSPAVGERTTIVVSSSTNDINNEDAESEDSDVSTTFIDGKRAISLHNFAKFTAQQQQQRKLSAHSNSRRLSTTMPPFMHQVSSPAHLGSNSPSSPTSIALTTISLTSPVNTTTTTTTTSSSTSSSSPTRRPSNHNNPHHLQIDLTASPAGLW